MAADHATAVRLSFLRTARIDRSLSPCRGAGPASPDDAGWFLLANPRARRAGQTDRASRVRRLLCVQTQRRKWLALDTRGARRVPDAQSADLPPEEGVGGGVGA